jgi:uncharacterized cupin superfamily protein
MTEDGLFICQTPRMNIWDDEWGEQQEDWSGGGGKAKRLVGSGPRLGASLYELEPNQANCPYHWHAANEELLLVLSGTVAIRTPDGTHEAGPGEVVAFPRGERGAHQLIARGDGPARFLMLSELRRPDICVYPDSGKVGVRNPGLRLNFRTEDAVDYWDGEDQPQ